MGNMFGSEEKPGVQKTVLNRKHAGGPHGIGDPNDKSLRKVETEVVIPKRMRDKARAENCLPEVEAFNACCKENSFKLVFNCRDVNNVMRDCLSKWYNDEGFRKQCTEEYLKERTEYRTTGIAKKTRRYSN